MRRYIRELRPTSVYDLAAMVALFRPGPMDNIPAYIRRKHGQEPVTYLHPLLEPYLEKTYGIFVYQEDIMAAAIALGGFTGPEADTLGYAIRKKKSAVLRAQKDKFVSQAAERGVEPRRHRRRLQGLRAVRALRLQQGPRHLLRPHRLPDRLPQGELHGRVHGQRADRVPGQHREGGRRHRRVPAHGHRGAAAGRPQQRPPLHRRGARPSASGCWPSRTSARAPSSRSSRAREADGRFRSLRRPVRAGGPAAGQQAGAGVAGQGRRASPRSATRRSCCSASTTPSPYGQAEQRDRVSGQVSLFD